MLLWNQGFYINRRIHIVRGTSPTQCPKSYTALFSSNTLLRRFYSLAIHRYRSLSVSINLQFFPKLIGPRTRDFLLT